MSEAYLAPPNASYKDRSTGLVFFGILTLLLGGLCALLVPLMLFGMMAGEAAGQPSDAKMLIPASAFYGVLAAALIWMGIGSIKARRWARALILVFSWSWLVFGTIAVIAMGFLLPNLLGSATPTDGQPLPDELKLIIMIASMLFYGVMFVVVPAVWVFFYRSPHVKATCEARDPVPRWTDTCPLPVLAVCLWLALSVPMMLMMPLGFPAVFPFFGDFLTGIAGSACFVVLGIVWAWCAWALYRLDGRAWWVLLILLCAFMVSHVMTYSRHDVMELYQLMGYTGEQLEVLRSMSAFMNPWMVWGVVVFMVPVLGYMIWIKKFFRRD